MGNHHINADSYFISVCLFPFFLISEEAKKGEQILIISKFQNVFTTVLSVIHYGVVCYLDTRTHE